MKKLILTILLILMLPMISAWGPHGHNWLSTQALSNSTQIGELCSSTEENRAAYLLGVEVPDLTVIYYYEEGGKEYRLTHNWNFQQEVMSQALTDNERCLAYGIAAHLVADSISHTQSVPAAIEKYRIPNWILHPLLEKKYDSALAEQYPDLIASTPHMMDALDGGASDRYIQMIEDAMGTNTQIRVRDELTKLKLAISGNNFYNSEFNPSVGGSWIFQGYYYVDKLTNFLAPYIGTINFGGIDYYFEKSKEQTIDTFNNWGARYQISPHGFDELSIADAKTGNTLTIILVLAFGLPIILAIWKKNYWYLALIPLLLIAVVAGVYSML